MPRFTRGMAERGSRAGAVCIGFVIIALAATSARAQIRIVDYNCAGLNGNQASFQAVLAALAADDKPGFAVAPALYTFQEVGSSDVGPLLTLLNAAAPPGVAYAQGTYTNNNENGVSGAQAMFYRADVVTEDPSGHIDLFTGAGREADRWKLSLVGHDAPPVVFYVYSAHLKASSGGSNESQRLAGATTIRDNADLFPAGTHIFYNGDWNVYNNNEPAYLKFLSAGNGQAFDPLGTGSWGGIANAIKHSQAPCNSGCSLVGGGMDDRFDFQLSTASLQNGEGFALIPGTYRSFGNDGNHYNTDINAGNNAYYPGDLPRSNTLADQLWAASDHVPVVADYQAPAAMSATMPSAVGRVIQGAAVSINVNVSNVADVIVAVGADELDYSVTGAGALSGAGGGSVAALAGPVSVPLGVDTSTVGPISGTAQVASSSESAQDALVNLPLSGQVVRASNASLASGSDLDATTIALAFNPDTGIQPIGIDVFNLGYDANQATLDVDNVGGIASPLSVAGPLPTGLAGAAGTIALQFDTTGAPPGPYNYSLTIDVSDEDILGETTA